MYIEFDLPADLGLTDAKTRLVAEWVAFIIYGDESLLSPPEKKENGAWNVYPASNDWFLHPPHSGLSNQKDTWKLDARYEGQERLMAIVEELKRLYV